MSLCSIHINFTPLGLDVVVMKLFKICQMRFKIPAYSTRAQQITQPYDQQTSLQSPTKIVKSFLLPLPLFNVVWCRYARNWTVSIGNYTVREELMKNTARIWWNELIPRVRSTSGINSIFIKYKRYFSLILRELRCNFLLISYPHKIRDSYDEKHGLGL